MNERAFQEFLATGEYVPAMDSDWRDNPFVQVTLEQHDRRFHPTGYKEGDACKVRERLATGDIVDSSIADVVAKAEAEEVIAHPAEAKIAKPKKVKLELETMTPEQLRDAAKALAGYKALMKEEKRDLYGRAHAKSGGELGVDGNWYEAGEFLPDNEYRDFVLKVTRAGASTDPEAPRPATKGEVSIWEKLDREQKEAIVNGLDFPDRDITKTAKLLAMTETTNGYDVDKLRSEDAVDYYLNQREINNYRWGGSERKLTREEAAENIEKMLENYDAYYARTMKRETVRKNMARHLFNLRKNGVFFVSDLYLIALRKSANLDAGMNPSVEKPFKFSWHKNGRLHTSIWFFLPKGTTKEQALEFWRRRHPEATTELKSYEAPDVVRFKDEDNIIPFPEFIYNKLPQIPLS